MPKDKWLSPQEVAGILARLGMNEIYSVGGHAVYASSQDRRVVIHFTEQWDIAFGEVARHLMAISFSQTEVEAALESLYADH